MCSSSAPPRSKPTISRPPACALRSNCSAPPTTQCRPTLPDNLPAVRLRTPRVLEVNGLYRHGYMIAPAMLDVVLELLATGDSPLARSFDLAVDTAEPTEELAA